MRRPTFASGNVPTTADLVATAWRAFATCAVDRSASMAAVSAGGFVVIGLSLLPSSGGV